MNCPLGAVPSNLLAVALMLSGCAAPAPRVALSRRPAAPRADVAVPELASLTQDQAVDGFVARALYVDDDEQPRGARFVHSRTGFVFDYLTIETAPQAFVYVRTYPTGDRGEAHTQEHLILDRGNQGRWLGNVERSSFARSNAFTTEHMTAYTFSTAAGPETFWRVMRTYFDALLHPDYSDEEIRREVRNFGVAKRPDGSLALDEKGTVYNEMVAQSEGAADRSWFALAGLIYGDGHPLASNHAGSPEGIRELTPATIRSFHASHYQLGNMGMVGALPSSISLQTVLARVGETLDAFAAAPAPPVPVLSEATVPPFRQASPGAIRIADYAYATADHPSRALLAWPASRRLDVDERTVMEMFLKAFGEGKGSVLYSALVDSARRVLELDATDVWTWTRPNHGEPVLLGVEGVGAAHANEESMSALRGAVRAQLEAIAALPDGSKELAAFDDRLRARIVDARRGFQKRLDAPPEFATTGTREDWIELLDDVGRGPGFRKSLTYRSATAQALALADPSRNSWRDRIRAWGLLDTPYAVAARPSPALRARLDQERQARLDAELARLEAQYGTHEPQEALRRREAEIAQASEAITKEEGSAPVPPIAPDPPMTYDDALKWTSETRGGVTRVASTFESMKSATVGLGLRLNGVPEELLPWLGVLPSLMSEVGVIRDGAPIPYDQVADGLRREVLGVKVAFWGDWHTGRAELGIEASGNGVDETKLALGWARTFLTAPDWRPENLPRIREVLAEAFARQHAAMSGPEEAWVEDVEESWRRQDRPELLHSRSFLTRAYDAFWTSWQLEGGDDALGVAEFLRSLGSAGKTLDRDSLARLAAALASADARGGLDPKIGVWVRAGRALRGGAEVRVHKAGRDLGQLLVDLPDSSLVGDWRALCSEMARGAARQPEEALAALDRTLAAVRHLDNARVWLVGSSVSQKAIGGDIERTLAALDPSPASPAAPSPRRRALERAQARGVKGDSPFVALVNPSMGSSSLVHTAPAPGFGETRAEALIDYLALEVFSAGTRSLGTRISDQALAYSGYVYASPSAEREELYVDRSPDLPQVLRFVDAEVREAPTDARAVDLVIAASFGSRGAYTFEVRAGGIAADLAEGWAPQRIRAFHERLLALRQRPGLADELHARAVPAMRPLIPSLDPATSPPGGALYFIVGPEPRVADHERQVHHALGDAVTVLRIWPRDFWDVGGPHENTPPHRP